MHGALKRRREAARAWLLDRLPEGVKARPDEWLIAFLCVTSGASTVLQVAESESLRATLPLIIVRLWGLCLLLGGALLAVGLSSIQATAVGFHVIRQVAVYCLACRLLATASLVYAASLVYHQRWDAVPALVPLVGFIAMLWIRLLTLSGREQ